MTAMVTLMDDGDTTGDENGEEECEGVSLKINMVHCVKQILIIFTKARPYVQWDFMASVGVSDLRMY